jgi:cytochrome b6-f complex iron-sulfur subunit
VNRREFLAGCAAGASLTGCIGFHYVNTSVAGNRLIVRLADFGSRRFALVDAPGLPLPLYLYRLDDGAFSAVSTRCMHRGCQVEPAAEHLVCPCHGSEYTNTGEIVKGPTQRPLRKLVVQQEGQHIAIELPASAEGW